MAIGISSTIRSRSTKSSELLGESRIRVPSRAPAGS